jgi:hypothetical protein
VFHIVKQPMGNFISVKREFGLDSRAIVAQIKNRGAVGRLLGRLVMKQTVVLCAVLVVFAAGAKAQAHSDAALPVAPVAALAAPAASPDVNPLMAAETAPASPAANDFAAGLSSDPGASSEDQEPPTVHGVFQTYNWQATAGDTFFRFYIVPHVEANMNGLNLGLVYYPRGKWIGGDGEFIGAWGSTQGLSTRYVQAMGGPRFRWAAPRGLEIWGHGLIGGSHFLPQTDLGNQSAFAYEVGGGVDLNVHQRRFAYRVSANMVGTHYFGTYQYSPNVSAGFVFKF